MNIKCNVICYQISIADIELMPIFNCAKSAFT